MTGCSTIGGLSQSLQQCECIDDFMIEYRNSALAAKAWHEHKHCHEHHAHLKHFSGGFRDGYQAVASGSNGCTPTIAPDQYWGWQYQSPEGQAKVAAWFAGYPMGVKAAEIDGLGHWSHIPTMFPPPAPVPSIHGHEELEIGPPVVELPPEGIPVRMTPYDNAIGNDLAPTPVFPADAVPHSQPLDAHPFMEEAPVDESPEQPLPEQPLLEEQPLIEESSGLEGTTARGPVSPFYLPR